MSAPDRLRAPAGFDPLDPAFVQNPYPTYANLRRNAPLFRAPQGYYVLSRYDDVAAALADPRFGNVPARHAVTHARNRERYVCADVAARILPFRDGPDHADDRRVLARVFHERLRELRPELDYLASDVLNECGEGGPRELLADFATPFAMRAICEFFGLPAQDIPRLKEFSHFFFYLFAPLPSVEIRERLDQSLLAFRAYFGEQLENRRSASGADDFLTRLARSDLDPTVLIDSCMLLLSDGVENVDSGIGNAVLALLQDAPALASIQKRSELLGAAIEECLRLESPAQFIARVVTEDVSMYGRTVRAGNAVLLLLGAANRDPAAFADADRLCLEPDSQRRSHLSFGRGAHACIGGGMVKAELEAALRALLLDRSVPELPADFQPRWQARGGHRWLEALPLTYS